MRAWLLFGLGALVLFSTGAAVLYFKKPKGRKAADAFYGPLHPGVQYTEADKGRVNLSPEWKAANLVPVVLHTGQTVLLHKKIAAEFPKLFAQACTASGHTPKSVQTFMARHTNWNPAENLSYHTYGVAVDFDPTLNGKNKPAGASELDKHPEFVRIFERAGWSWGGRWKSESLDPMHFQAVV